MKKIFIITFAAASVMLTGKSIAKMSTPTPVSPMVLTDALTIDDFMVFDADEYDFGTIEEGVKAKHIFTFVNKGKAPIVVNNARPSCGCTTPEWSKEPVKPGKSGTITAIYDTNGRPGPFNKTITLSTNMGDKVIKIKGTVKPKS